MSSILKDALDRSIKRVSRVKKPDWESYRLAGESWKKVSEIMVGVLDELKADGIQKPLSVFQDFVFKRALKFDASKDKKSHPLHTVSLWLTDTRAWIEIYSKDKNDSLARDTLLMRKIIGRGKV